VRTTGCSYPLHFVRDPLPPTFIQESSVLPFAPQTACRADSWPGQCRSAKPVLTTATCSVSAVSAAVKSRPVRGWGSLERFRNKRGETAIKHMTGPRSLAGVGCATIRSRPAARNPRWPRDRRVRRSATSPAAPEHRRASEACRSETPRMLHTAFGYNFIRQRNPTRVNPRRIESERQRLDFDHGPDRQAREHEQQARKPQSPRPAKFP